MGWIKLHPVDGPEAYFNTNHIAYVAAPPEDEAARGVRAGIAMTDNTRSVIPVLETPEEVRTMLRMQEDF